MPVTPPPPKISVLATCLRRLSSGIRKEGVQTKKENSEEEMGYWDDWWYLTGLQKWYNSINHMVEVKMTKAKLFTMAFAIG